MRVFEIQDEFGLDHLVPADHPEIQPGPGEVLVEMKAASLNYRDLMTVRGQYNPKQPLPLVPCSDGVGVVKSTGAGVSRLQAGDRVATVFAQGWLGGSPDPANSRTTLGGPRDGTLAQSMVLNENGLVKVPAHLSDAEGATLPCAAVTAWRALVTLGNVRAGDTVLVQGTGGVSIFALQFAVLLGARVIVTSSSDAKLAKARELGAWQGINYKDEPKWGEKARDLTGGEGVDHIVEVGGAGTLEQSLEAIRLGGEISVIGVLSGVASEMNIIPILMKQARLQGIFVGSREDFKAMNRAIEQHQMHPVVDRIFPFADTPEAFRHMAGARHFGKICIDIAAGP